MPQKRVKSRRAACMHIPAQTPLPKPNPVSRAGIKTSACMPNRSRSTCQATLKSETQTTHTQPKPEPSQNAHAGSPAERKCVTASLSGGARCIMHAHPTSCKCSTLLHQQYSTHTCTCKQVQAGCHFLGPQVRHTRAHTRNTHICTRAGRTPSRGAMPCMLQHLSCPAPTARGLPALFEPVHLNVWT